MVTFVQATFFQAAVFWWHLYISGISQLLLTRFGLNFKGKVKARSRQSQCKVGARLEKCQGKVKARPRQGHGKVKVRSSQGQANVKERSGQGKGNVRATSRQDQGKQGQGKVKANLHFWGPLHFEVVFIFYVVILFEIEYNNLISCS